MRDIVSLFSHNIMIYRFHTMCTIVYESSGDIAVDWITNKVYWTDDGQLDRICLLDIPTGHHTTVIYTGHNTSPRALIVDPIRRSPYVLSVS